MRCVMIVKYWLAILEDKKETGLPVWMFFSLIFLISCLCQPENIPAFKYSVNIPKGVFSLLLTVAGMYASFGGAVNATFFVLKRQTKQAQRKNNYIVDTVSCLLQLLTNWEINTVQYKYLSVNAEMMI